MVRRISDAGHEVASHGYAHQRASDLSPHEFGADIRLAKAILEDITGREVTGYRAPSFSIGESNLWAHDCIAEAGYRYSSSVYPVKHDHYGIPDAPRFPWRLDNGLLEVPVTTLNLLGRNWPAGGGGFFRLLPYPVSRWQIARVNAGDQRPAIFYFHPWEIDPEQPRVTDATVKTRFRHYINLRHTEARLDRLLSDFAWGRADEVFCNAA
jgi:polysaccharide deacetylase family protein (PEP-CTERM system associated)